MKKIECVLIRNICFFVFIELQHHIQKVYLVIHSEGVPTSIWDRSPLAIYSAHQIRTRLLIRDTITGQFYFIPLTQLIIIWLHGHFSYIIHVLIHIKLLHYSFIISFFLSYSYINEKINQAIENLFNFIVLNWNLSTLRLLLFYLLCIFNSHLNFYSS